VNKIFAGQSALRLVVKTFVDLEGAAGALIKYRKPDKTTGSFPAAVIDGEKGVIAHECIEGEMDQGGWWTLWAFIAFDDGRTAAGEAVKVYVWDEGAAL
jgi:hypothetical protein